MKLEHKEPPWPPAIVFFTNKPSHYLSDETPASGQQCVITGVNMSDFRENADASLELHELLERHPELDALLDPLHHHLVPADW